MKFKKMINYLLSGEAVTRNGLRPGYIQLDVKDETVTYSTKELSYCIPYSICVIDMEAEDWEIVIEV